MKTLLSQLVAAAPTAENGEWRAAEVLNLYFRRHGLAAEMDIWDGNRANVIVQLNADRNADAPPLLVAGHLDVVPAEPNGWTSPPFVLTERQGRLYGRGTTDMLGGLAAAAAALVDSANKTAALRRNVVFAATAGEETDSCGTKRFVQWYRQRFNTAAGVLIPEPTDLEVLRAHRGIVWLKVCAHGRTAHGSMPQLGINAILKINAILNRLKNFTIPHTPHPLLGNCSMSVNRIAGGSGTNIVPEQCAMEIDIRTLPGQSAEAIVKRFEELLEEMAGQDPDFKADVSVLRTAGAVETAADAPFVREVCAAAGTDRTGAVGFTTDGPYFAPLGPVVIFGPGTPPLCHKTDEYIEIAALERAKEICNRIFQER